jgi:hypothetical protein
MYHLLSRANRREDIVLDGSSKSANVRLHIAMGETAPAHLAHGHEIWKQVNHAMG